MSICPKTTIGCRIGCVEGFCLEQYNAIYQCPARRMHADQVHEAMVANPKDSYQYRCRWCLKPMEYKT